VIAQTLAIGVGLSMDAFAVSLCNGLTLNKDKVKTGLVIALFFGAFQAIMPMIGYFKSFSRWCWSFVSRSIFLQVRTLFVCIQVCRLADSPVRRIWRQAWRNGSR